MLKNESEMHAVLDDSGLDMDEPVPGGTILSILSEFGVNPNTCGRANSIWICCDHITCGCGYFRIPKKKVPDSKISAYVWTGSEWNIYILPLKMLLFIQIWLPYPTVFCTHLPHGSLQPHSQCPQRKREDPGNKDGKITHSGWFLQ